MHGSMDRHVDVVTPTPLFKQLQAGNNCSKLETTLKEPKDKEEKVTHQAEGEERKLDSSRKAAILFSSSSKEERCE
jgi:hypothetical protein